VFNLLRSGISHDAIAIWDRSHPLDTNQAPANVLFVVLVPLAHKIKDCAVVRFARLVFGVL
jgi:hypothetical protein